MSEKLSDKDVFYLLAHLGDAIYRVDEKVNKKIIHIQKEVGVHESVDGSGKMVKELLDNEYNNE